MSEINLIITRQEDLKAMLFEWLDAHPVSQLKQSIASDTLEKPMSRAETAAFLGITKVTLNDWMKKGLPHKRLNGRVYFIKEEVMDAMNTYHRRKKNMMDS